MELEFEPENERLFGPCACCGKMTRRVWGYMKQDDGTSPSAAYFVEWTPGHPNHEANFDFIYGLWGDATAATDRMALSAAFRHHESKPSFMAIDSALRPIASNSLVGSTVTREQALGTDLRGVLFELCDAVYLGDPRIAELRTV